MKFCHFLAALSITMVSISCGTASKGKPFQTHFWTSSSWGEQLFVMVDDTIKGPLPYLPESPQCGSDHLESGTLSLTLSSGQHEVVVQNKDGKVFFEEILTLKNSKNEVNIASSTDFHESASKRIQRGDCLIEEIYKK